MLWFVWGMFAGAVLTNIRYHYLLRKRPKPTPEGFINHWPKGYHFKGITSDNQKFVYCPVGRICSWHPGDYDNDWCHWCKLYYVTEGADRENPTH